VPDFRIPSHSDLPPRWTTAVAAGVLAAQQRSGLTDEAFALQTGIQTQRLRKWRSRLAPVRLVEVFARVPRVEPEGSVHVLTPSGWRIEVPIRHLGELVRVLGGGSC